MSASTRVVRITSGTKIQYPIALIAGMVADTSEGKRYGNRSKIVPANNQGRVLAGSASPPPIMGPVVVSTRLCHEKPRLTDRRSDSPTGRQELEDYNASATPLG